MEHTQGVSLGGGQWENEHTVRSLIWSLDGVNEHTSCILRASRMH